ncbi:MAG: signal peptidase II [Candidatus Omnitrophica bacterium]|nr:signal peptidase II [Candidatus Omnitrophota bacterium]
MSKLTGKQEIKSILFLYLFAAFLYGLDRVTKLLVISKIKPDASIPVVSGIFHITYVQNTGVAFGLFKDIPFFFICVGLLAVILIVSFLVKKYDKICFRDRIALVTILSGTLGNLVDRIRHGYVVDFLDFRVWPVFNIADSAICIGVFLLMVSFFTNSTTRLTRNA